MASAERVAIIGGGITGLAAAHYLTRAGCQVSLFEASEQFGGLGTFFEHEQATFERFYHCMLPTDNDLLQLLTELALEKETYWKETSFGYLDGKKIYPLNTAIDLLRFSPLSMLSRIRVGLTGLYGSLVSDKGLDDITSAQWLKSLSGEDAFNKFWLPLLKAKFGDRYDQIPALWFWTRFNREKGSAKEQKGYIRGGYKRIVDALLLSIEQHGGEIYGECPVREIDISQSGEINFYANNMHHSCDRIIITTPLPLLKNLASENFHKRCLEGINLEIDMQGVLNVILFLDKPLSQHYWVAASSPDVPFQGIVETSDVIAPGDRSNFHLVHLMNYCHRTSADFNQPLDEFKRNCIDKLCELFPHLARENIKHEYAFKAPFVEPIYTLGYATAKPPEELLPGKVYLLTTAQVYPTVTSWNGSVGQVRKVISHMGLDSAQN
ncbi:MAG: FAD-dependent oxidoreductase [Bdellovibrionales bacterium]|nr:FAD-dependent oxidoreductase [Bdellovibrionales bacterium]